jgi:hypothetical protein
MAPKKDAKAQAREQAQQALKERKEKEAKAQKAAVALRKQKKEEAALSTDTLKLLREVRELGNDPDLNQATETFRNLIASTKIEEVEGRPVITATADIEPCHSKVPAGEYFGTHLARANDAATPNWKKLIIDQKGDADLDGMMKIWQEYREKSVKAANYQEGVPVCVNELMGAYYMGYLRDKNHPSNPRCGRPLGLRFCDLSQLVRKFAALMISFGWSCPISICVRPLTNGTRIRELSGVCLIKIR